MTSQASSQLPSQSPLEAPVGPSLSDPTDSSESAPLHAPPQDGPPPGVLTRVKNGAAFGLSAVLSPYIVLPIGTATIIGSIAAQKRLFVIYTLISVFFSTILPALFVVIQVRRGKITDVHIMDRSQRGTPFWVAIGSSAVGALVLKLVGAEMNIWSISAVLALNGLILTWITSFWKISMHVAVLSATVTSALMMIPNVQAAPLLILIPALIWARVTRGRHTLWQGLAGASLAAIISGGCFFILRCFYHEPTRQAVQKFFGQG